VSGLLSGPAGDGPAGDRLEMVLPGIVASVPAARGRFREFLAALEIGEEERAEVLLLFGEAVTNAIQHGSPRGENDRIRIECRIEGSDLRIAVTDEGPGFEPGALLPLPRGDAGAAGGLDPGTLTASGRGIVIMQACGRVGYEFPGRGTVCRLEYHLP